MQAKGENNKVIDKSNNNVVILCSLEFLMKIKSGMIVLSESELLKDKSTSF